MIGPVRTSNDREPGHCANAPPLHRHRVETNRLAIPPRETECTGAGGPSGLVEGDREISFESLSDTRGGRYNDERPSPDDRSVAVMLGRGPESRGTGRVPARTGLSGRWDSFHPSRI